MLLRVYGILSVFLSIVGSIYYGLIKRDASVLERWGFRGEKFNGTLWLHASSMGEVNGIIPIVRRIRERFPYEKVLVSTSTRTGLERLRSRQVIGCLAPFDDPFSLSRFIKRNSFHTLIISETEIWPGMIKASLDAGIRVVFINGRVSERTAARFARLGAAISQLFNKLSLVCAVDSSCAERYKTLGVPSENIKVCGNSKYDHEPIILDPIVTSDLRDGLIGEARIVLTLGCIHPEEWQQISKQLLDFLQSREDVALIVAPRHLDKLPHFLKTFNDLAIDFCLYSSRISGEPSERLRYMIVDQMGVLDPIYAVSDIVVMGGTFNHLGGHNPLEPANYGVGLIFGPNVSAIRDLVERLEELGAAFVVTDTQYLTDRISKIVANPELLGTMKSRSLFAAKEYRGSGERIFASLIEADVLGGK